MANMHKVFEVLEAKGLVTEKDVTRIEDLKDKDTVKFYENVYTTVYEAQKQRAATTDKADELDPFTFLAGASLRGDTCFNPMHRIQKLDFLGRYAALYANELTVPLPLNKPDNVGSINHARTVLSLSAITLLRLRPLIDHGIVSPAVMTTPVKCVHEQNWVKKMTELVHDVADEAAEERLADFSVVYQVPEKSPTGHSTLYIKGPRQFLEHGSIVSLFDERPNSGARAKVKAKTWRIDNQGKVELRGDWKLKAVRKVFNEVANNTCFYLAYGRLHRSRMLSDLPGETFVLNWLTGDEQLAATSSAMKSLTHAVPLLAELPIATVIRIRREERDSFQTYRSAIARIASDVLRDNRKLSKKEAQEMLKTSIEPELIRLRKEMRFERKRQVRRVAGGIATLAAGIAIGAFGGLPVVVGGALAGAAAVTGGGLLKKAAEVACEHGANLRQQNDFYFLVRLLEEAQS